MSEFIFIIPEGWTTFSPEQLVNVSQPITIIQSWIDGSNYTDITTVLREAQLLQTNEYLIEAKVFNGELLVARVGTD